MSSPQDQERLLDVLASSEAAERTTEEDFVVDQREPSPLKSFQPFHYIRWYHLIGVSIIFFLLLASFFVLGRFSSQTSSSCNNLIASDTPEVICDIGIIGGGVGGVYAAHRLSSSLNIKKSICLFESSTRIGGRLWSRTVKGAEDMQLEVGGMRFLENVHRLVHNLGEWLDLTHQPQPVIVPGNYFVLRNQYLTWNTYMNGSVPYYFTANESKLLLSSQAGPVIFYEQLLKQVLPSPSVYNKWTSCDWQQWVQTAKFKGRLLNNLGIEYCLRQLLSSEALAAFGDFVGFSDVLSQANAAEMIAWERKEDAVSGGAPFTRWNEGYQQIPIRLLEKAKADGVQVFLNHSLEANLGRQGSDRNILLRFKDGKTAQVRDHLIYALPRGALESITHLGPELETRQAVSAIKSIIGFELFKLFLVFDSPWWLSSLPSMQCLNTGACGTITHSEPDRRIFFWGVANAQPHANSSSSTAAAIMVTYTDGPSARYWTSMIANEEPGPFYLRPTSYSDIVESPSSGRYLAVEEAMRELQSAVSAANASAVVPQPYAAVFADWTSRVNQGVHLFGIGFDAPAVRSLLQDGQDVSVCGEAYSDMQGWVEGALRSCETLLIKKWSLPPPLWYNSTDLPLEKYLSCA